MTGALTDADARVGFALGFCLHRFSATAFARRLLTADAALLAVVAMAPPVHAAKDLATPLATMPTVLPALPAPLPAGPPEAIAPYPDRGARKDAGLWEERERRLGRLQNTVNCLELTSQMLNIVDAVQTTRCMQRPDCHEAHPLFGRQPRPRQ